MKITVRQLKQLIKEQVEEIKNTNSVEDKIAKLKSEIAELKASKKNPEAYRLKKFCDRINATWVQGVGFKPSGKLGVYLDRKGKKLATITLSEVDEKQFTLTFDPSAIRRATTSDNLNRGWKPWTDTGPEEYFMFGSRGAVDAGRSINNLESFIYDKWGEPWNGRDQNSDNNGP